MAWDYHDDGSDCDVSWRDIHSSGQNPDVIYYRMKINGNGNVGIGTSDPKRKFHIHEPTASTPVYLQLTNASSGAGSSDGFHIQQSSNGLVTYLINRENGHMIFYTNNTERVRIEPAGDVGIGTNNPTQKLHVRGNYYQDNTTHSGRFWTVKGVSGQGGLGFEWAGGGHDKNLNISMHNNSGNFIGVGFIENSGSGSWRLNDFTGQHRCMPQNNVSADKFGLIVYSTGKYINIDNNLKPTMNDSLPICDLCNTDNDKRVFGVISDDRDDNNERNLGYGVFQTIQPKANTNEKRIYINSVGEGGMWVCNKNGNISNGDYITSCTISGYGAKQASIELVNSTVAKITCDCDFDITPVVKQKVKVTETTITKQREVRQDVTRTETEIVFENNKWQEKTVTKTTSEEVYDDLPLYNENGELSLLTHRVQRMEDYTETTTQLVFDSNGNIQYEDDLDANGNQQMEYKYETRFLNADATIIATEAEYNTKKANGENVYIAQFVGCTYHCG